MEMKTRKFSLVSEMLLILCLGGGIFFVAGKYDFLEALLDFSRRHEDLELDEIVPTVAVISLGLLVFVLRRWQEVRCLEKALREKNRSLATALDQIQTLEGILPLCAGCKKVRNDQGYWEQVDAYIENHSKARVSHSMCPDCLESFYGKEAWYKKMAAGDPGAGG